MDAGTVLLRVEALQDGPDDFVRWAQIDGTTDKRELKKLVDELVGFGCIEVSRSAGDDLVRLTQFGQRSLWADRGFIGRVGHANH